QPADEGGQLGGPPGTEHHPPGGRELERHHPAHPAPPRAGPRECCQNDHMATMTNDEAVGLLSEAGRTGKLATASPSGNPHVAPVWFVVDGDDLVFTTGQDTIKARHLRANPR